MIARTYELARLASNEGNPPFGALLVHGDSVVAEMTNTGRSTGDLTRHAEIGLIGDASRRFGRDYLGECWLYTSTEPCVMCSGAIRWARIPRVVYGTPQNLEGRFQEIPCREILKEITPQTEVIGPVLQEEGRAIRSQFGRGGRGAS
jgi:tRNA(Arg) A34 adenosine deaminase TadA